MSSEQLKYSSNFKKVFFPDGVQVLLPDDVTLEFPEYSSLPMERQHFLVSIPWEDKYVELVPEEYRNFFVTVLPYLKFRTTDVHTAICMNFLDEFEDAFINQRPDMRVVGLALVLHDVGWGKLSEEEVAESLGVRGLKLSKKAMGPKEKHAIVGAEFAKELLLGYKFEPELTQKQLELIVECISNHDKQWEMQAEDRKVQPEVKMLADLDHLWAFSHENFWQDTVRKGISPDEYLKNLKDDLDGYFVTDFGKIKSKSLWDEREKEVMIWRELDS